MNNKRAVALAAVIALGVIITWVCLTRLAAQSRPSIMITSPSDGTVVISGQTVLVSIQPGPETSLKMVSAYIPPLSEVPPTLQTPPFQIPVMVPTDRLGNIILKAVAVTQDGVSLQSTIHLVIQSSAAVSAIQVLPQSVVLSMRGDTRRLYVTAMLDDGNKVNVTAASGIVYSSRNLQVATISSDGKITGTAPGVTSINISYRNAAAVVPVSVGIFELKGDLNGDGDVDQDDLDILLKALNTAATGPGDPRDLNGDGRIDALDARILTTLCSRPRCSVQ
jgi:hypothetical protein